MDPRRDYSVEPVPDGAVSYLLQEAARRGFRQYVRDYYNSF